MNFTQDDSITQESIGTKKEEKIVVNSIIKIQSMFRMVLQKMRYTQMQENKEEEILAEEGESNLKLPIKFKTENIDKASVINNEAGKLNVDIAVQE